MAVKAHICIGGPLDGQHRTYKEIQDEHPYPSREYLQFNTAYRYSTTLQRASKRAGTKLQECHVVWVHRSLLQPAKTLGEHEATK